MFAILSNLALLIPAGTAWKYNRLLTAFIFFSECFISMFYHICDYFGVCIFNFQALHYFDFFFAQWIIPRMGFYLIVFTVYYEWVEWMMLLFAALAIALLEVWFPGTLVVQAGIAAATMLIVVFYWVFWEFPEYYWSNLLIGVSLLMLSISFYVFQTLYSPYYDVIHGFWHISASLGAHFVIVSRPPAGKYENAANRINNKFGRL